MKIISIILMMGIFGCTAKATDVKSGATERTKHSEKLDNIQSVIELPKPDFANKVSLMEALNQRKSTRSFANKPINKQDLSNLLWAAGGINRKNGGRTIPLLGDIGIYVAMQTGVYLYQPKKHELKRIISEDIRAQISEQSTVKQAPLVFIYAIDDDSFPDFMSKAMKEAHGMDFYYGNQTAYSTQNVYLYACSNKMNAVVIGGFKREFVDEKLLFDENRNSYLIQLVGYSN